MNRLEWILGIILVLLLVVVGALSLTFWFRNDRTAVSAPASNSAAIIADRADDIAPTPTFDGRSAIVAYAAAQNTAVAWQPDAQLFNAQATWPQGSTADELRQGKTSWGFTFYSPATASMALISVLFTSGPTNRHFFRGGRCRFFGISGGARANRPTAPGQRLEPG